MSSDAWNDVTTSLSESDDVTYNDFYIRDRVLKVIYIIIGTVGVVDNLFVIVVFILFIKISKKVQFLLETFKRIKCKAATSSPCCL